MLTVQQWAALKAHIAANTNTVLINNVATQIKNVVPSPDNANSVAAWYNLAASPAFVVWKRAVPIMEVGDSFESTAVAGLTTANNSRLQTMAQYAGGRFNPSKTDIRAAFDDIFSAAAGNQTRANLLALWKESAATNAVKLFSTGTGSDASPATPTANIEQGFLLKAADVFAAWNS